MGPGQSRLIPSTKNIVHLQLIERRTIFVEEIGGWIIRLHWSLGLKSHMLLCLVTLGLKFHQLYWQGFLKVHLVAHQVGPKRWTKTQIHNRLSRLGGLSWLLWLRMLSDRTWEAIIELPDWNVEERDLGIIDLKRRMIHLSWTLLFWFCYQSLHSKGLAVWKPLIHRRIGKNLPRWCTQEKAQELWGLKPSWTTIGSCRNPPWGASG